MIVLLHDKFKFICLDENGLEDWETIYTAKGGFFEFQGYVVMWQDDDGSLDCTTYTKGDMESLVCGGTFKVTERIY